MKKALITGPLATVDDVARVHGISQERVTWLESQVERFLAARSASPLRPAVQKKGALTKISARQATAGRRLGRKAGKKT